MTLLSRRADKAATRPRTATSTNEVKATDGVGLPKPWLTGPPIGIPPMAAGEVVDADLPVTMSMNSIAAYMGICCTAWESALGLLEVWDLWPEATVHRARRTNQRVGAPMMTDHVNAVCAPASAHHRGWS